ncbi:MAG: hypothetical protein JRN61_03750 [Nitrososphaerota archaeon]|nr:hypothetical protein [Nitrososphaerota archaeon]MDG7048073.1 hypothetical protein [Nitrososphaerota archaeon]
MAKKVRITIMIDGDLLEDIDRLQGKRQLTELRERGKATTSRSMIIEDAIRYSLLHKMS